jgi:omega-amidase
LLQLPVSADKSTNLSTAREYVIEARESGASLCVLPEIWNSPYATAAFPDYAELLPDVGDSIADDDDVGGGVVVVVGGGDGDDDDDRRRGRGSSWGESSQFLMEVAKSTGMYVVGGSVPEVVHHRRTAAAAAAAAGGDHEEEKEGRRTTATAPRYYNTCLIVDPSGRVIGKHRKLHLFDVSVPGGIRFKESDTLTGGDLGATYFDVVVPEEERGGGEEGGDGGGGLGRIGVGIWYVVMRSLVSHAWLE